MSFCKAPAHDPVVPYCCYVPPINREAFELAAPGPERLAAGCGDPLEFELIFGSRPDDYTHACRAHVGDLIPDGVEARVIPVRPVVVGATYAGDDPNSRYGDRYGVDWTYPDPQLKD